MMTPLDSDLPPIPYAILADDQTTTDPQPIPLKLRSDGPVIGSITNLRVVDGRVKADYVTAYGSGEMDLGLAG
jgi:hypothetical protein